MALVLLLAIMRQEMAKFVETKLMLQTTFTFIILVLYLVISQRLSLLKVLVKVLVELINSKIRCMLQLEQVHKVVLQVLVVLHQELFLVIIHLLGLLMLLLR